MFVLRVVQEICLGYAEGDGSKLLKNVVFFSVDTASCPRKLESS